MLSVMVWAPLGLAAGVLLYILNVLSYPIIDCLFISMLLNIGIWLDAPQAAFGL